jgi:hypothetical protein
MILTKRHKTAPDKDKKEYITLWLSNSDIKLLGGFDAVKVHVQKFLNQLINEAKEPKQ